MREAVIVAGARTPVGKAKKGTLANVRPDDLAALTIKGTLMIVSSVALFRKRNRA